MTAEIGPGFLDQGITFAPTGVEWAFPRGIVPQAIAAQLAALPTCRQLDGIYSGPVEAAITRLR